MLARVHPQDLAKRRGKLLAVRRPAKLAMPVELDRICERFLTRRSLKRAPQFDRTNTGGNSREQEVGKRTLFLASAAAAPVTCGDRRIRRQRIDVDAFMRRPLLCNQQAWSVHSATRNVAFLLVQKSDQARKVL